MSLFGHQDDRSPDRYGCGGPYGQFVDDLQGSQIPPPTPESVARILHEGTPPDDFAVPGAVARDLLTEAWPPFGGDVEQAERWMHTLRAIGFVAFVGFVFLAGYLVGVSAHQ